jgi:hypothetical protein
MKTRKVWIVTASAAVLFLCTLTPRISGWGDDGHRFVNQVAAANLPEDMPAFFRDAAVRLAFLGPEPDRWRDGRQVYKALREASGPDHFVDIDKPEDFRALPDDRYQYANWLRTMGKEPKDVGFLPYASLEGFEQVQVMFRLWRDPRYANERGQIEQNAIFYAGVLGHYIADGANPLHTTIHYNGWSTSLNPDHFTREPLHNRFESEYVQAQVKPEDFKGLVKKAVRLPDPFSDIVQYLVDSYGMVPELYRLEKQARWGKDNTNPESRQFVARRLAAAAQMLANLWYTAWLDSELPPAPLSRR